MSLKRNIFANYVGQGYSTLIGVVMVPLYLRYMGVEAYGLVGFFTMMQGWFQLLDLGLTPTMAREVARYRGGAIDASTLRSLMRVMEAIFVALGLGGALLIAAFAGTITQHWLQVRQLPLSEVTATVILMGIGVSLRWVGGLYRSVIVGLERQVWLNVAAVAISTVRFVLIVPVFIWVGATPRIFFSFQLAVAAGECLVLAAAAHRWLPPLEAGKGMSRWSLAPIRGVMKFSMTIAFLAAVWVMVTQTDKLILSKLLPLEEYACFTLALVVAGAITLVNGPISQAVLPRLARLAAEGDEAGLRGLYRDTTQVIGAIVFPVAAMMAVFAEPLLHAWTGDLAMAAKAAPVVRLYAIGNGLLAIAGLNYFLQYAKGDLRLHLWGNVLFVAILIPALILVTLRWGMTGAGWVWLVANLAWFLAWSPLVHRRFAPGLHPTWLLQDVAPFLLVAAAGAWLWGWVPLHGFSRLVTLLCLGLMGCCVLAATVVLTRQARTFLRARWSALKEAG